MSFLFALIPAPYRLAAEAIAIALIIAAFALLWADRAGLKADNAIYDANHAVDQAALAGAVEALEQINKSHAQDLAAIAADAEASRSIRQSTEATIKEMRHAPKPQTPCGPDPAVDALLDRLRGSPSGGSAGDQGRAPDHPGAPAGAH